MKWMKEEEAACILRDHEEVLFITKDGVLRLGEYVDDTPPHYYHSHLGYCFRDLVKWVLRVDDLEIPFDDCIITDDRCVSSLLNNNKEKNR